ncbi:glycosyltransferase family 9 protein [Anaeromyxobacter diazotrophicus]|uniref:ADP-heptose--LPS heptosyltransferase n=1 Tax=Anaeromyxobacter diazotrophicus TaxID=2590199 RepID=A0A7I9VJJ1_9BACT|nr:glycosyltransferase family 9 protein [Anaeromyxobacter diazotrophicus]GEJ56328.1 ADP-heptose--LPS heptosyltransferase [Anaeromyxobacter diazotrophicus]
MRVLVLQPGYLGDTVFLGPAVRALKARWPEGRVGLCVTPRGAPAARLLPGCDEVLVFDKRGADRGPAGLWRAGRRLRAFGAELALVPHVSARTGLLAWLSGAPRRIGYAPLCTERVRLDRGRPFVDRALVLAERAGAPGEPALALDAPAAHAAYAEGVLAGARRPVVGLVPGAEWATKRWAAERFAALAAELVRDGATPVLLGGPSERALASRIQALSGGALRDTTGNAIDEAVAVLARCDLVVGGDTGLVHCARALQRPALVLFGPTAPERHRFTHRERALTVGIACQPCHDHGPPTCPLGHHGCLAQLEVAQVAGAARALLQLP